MKCYEFNKNPFYKKNELAHCTLQSIQETLGGKNIMLGNNIVIIV